MGYRGTIEISVHGKRILSGSERCAFSLRHHKINIVLKPVKMDKIAEKLWQLGHRMSNDRKQIRFKKLSVVKM